MGAGGIGLGAAPPRATAPALSSSQRHAKRWWASLAALALGCAACGGGKGPPLLWEVTSAQGKSSFLLGTVHLGVAARADLPAAVWNRFDGSTSFSAEAEVRTISSQEYLKAAAISSGQNLDQLVPAAVWTEVTTILGGMSPSTLRTLRPWAVSGMIFQALVPTAEGMDVTFLNAADIGGKKLVFLETWQDQVATLNQTSLDEDVQDLVDLVQDRAAIIGKFNELVERYKNGDADAVLRLAPEAGAVPASTDPSFETLIRARNQRWLPIFEQQINSGSAFIAVGFGHLLGAEGLLQTLSTRGFTVKRVE
jgi:uncharacterized protein